MKNPEKEFKRELDIFRTETQSGTQFFYSYLAINAVIAGNKEALEALNNTPLFLGTNFGALKTSFFIVLGRIFDQKSKHNIDRLLRIAQNHSEIFSKAFLEERKSQSSPNAYRWLPEYLEKAYEPTPEDFRRLRKHIKKYRHIYEMNYRSIRHKIYAHRELSDKADVQKLYKKTRVGELQKIFIFLNKLHVALRELYLNGRKPVLRPMRYSVVRIKDKPRSDSQRHGVHEKIVDETQKFFRIFTRKVQQPH